MAAKWPRNRHKRAESVASWERTLEKERKDLSHRYDWLIVVCCPVVRLIS